MVTTHLLSVREKNHASQGYMEALKLDDHEIQSRRDFFELSDEDLQRLQSLRGFAEKNTNAITDNLYELILNHPEARVFFPNQETVDHVKKMQNIYFLRLFSGKCDRDYVQDRLRVGAIHEKIGMPPKWYLGSYRRYLGVIYDKLLQEFGMGEKAVAAFHSVKKIIFFDMALAIDTYIAAHVETLNRQKAAIRELSTPVIRVQNEIMLLPLVGTVDTQRAQQIMETALSRIVEEKARVLILDIAGVPVVDTKVADHLIQTTAAVRLLGAETILTGISAQIAQTIVQLGVEIGSMHTRALLADGISLALDIVGKKVIDKEAA